jgi:hypothetical protein
MHFFREEQGGWINVAFIRGFRVTLLNGWRIQADVVGVAGPWSVYSPDIYDTQVAAQTALDKLIADTLMEVR